MKNRHSKTYKVNEAFVLGEQGSPRESIHERSPSVGTIDGRPAPESKGFPTKAESIDFGLDDVGKEGKKTTMTRLCLDVCIVVFFVLAISACLALALYFVLSRTVFRNDLTTGTGQIVLQGSVLINATFHQDLNNPTSTGYRDTENTFLTAMDTTFMMSNLSDIYLGTEVIRFEPGSIRVIFEMYFLSSTNSPNEEQEEMLTLAIRVSIEGALSNQAFENIDVISNSLEIGRFFILTTPNYLTTGQTENVVPTQQSTSTYLSSASGISASPTVLTTASNPELSTSSEFHATSPRMELKVTSASTDVANTAATSQRTDVPTSRQLPNETQRPLAAPETSTSTPQQMAVTRQPKVHTALPDICGVRPAITDSASRIVGGTAAGPGAWPWMGSLRDGQYHQCGAALVHEEWAITAHHCVGYFNNIVVGDNNQTGTPSTYRVQRNTQTFPNGNFDSVTDVNDIALVRLTVPVEFNDYVQPLCINTRMTEVTDFTNCYITGWGTHDFDIQIASNELLEARVQLFNETVCSTWYTGSHVINSLHLCAGEPDGSRDACSGDSGGPLQCQDSQGVWYLVGVVSTGQECGLPKLPGIYTRVSTQITFLSDILDTHIT